MKIIGIEKVNYNRKQDNRPVIGIKFYCTIEKKNVEGAVTIDPVYVSSSFPEYAEVCNLKIGDNITPLYDRNGRLQAIDLA